ncbi:hypothetical protein G7Y89_g8497 [Cudoniella acicularis]|uniref:Uncharacterized protein n=1 Tax=Cudoniella acicularis TaxID=354080 RepID=A0A8H4RHD3_9HELO|nr:hypothetical protein G7Y89_g8497 [Cudoniella acicularis]
MEKDPPSNTTDGGDDVAVYHIYHNHRDANKSYSIHSLRDSHAPLSVACTADLPTSISRASTLKPQSSNEPALGFWARQKIRAARAKAYDKPGKDPRTETAPYFLHSPKLYFRSPPYTLRKGGNKRAEVVGLLKPNFGWMKWEVQFGDVLKQEGVVDGRGVVNWRYGTKNGEYGTLKGYPEREKRYLGESGKAWFNLQKEIGDTIPEADEKAKPEETVRLRHHTDALW